MDTSTLYVLVEILEGLKGCILWWEKGLFFKLGAQTLFVSTYEYTYSTHTQGPVSGGGVVESHNSPFSLALKRSWPPKSEPRDKKELEAIYLDL